MADGQTLDPRTVLALAVLPVALTAAMARAIVAAPRPAAAQVVPHAPAVFTVAWSVVYLLLVGVLYRALEQRRACVSALVMWHLLLQVRWCQSFFQCGNARRALWIAHVLCGVSAALAVAAPGPASAAILGWIATATVLNAFLVRHPVIVAVGRCAAAKSSALRAA